MVNLFPLDFGDPIAFGGLVKFKGSGMCFGYTVEPVCFFIH
jgi:hypothetical protein